MRINNSKTKNIVISVYFLLIVLTLVFTTVFNAFREISINPALIFIITIFVYLALFILLFGVTKFFEYDSDGLKVGIMNKGLLSTDYLSSKEHALEFEKKNLISFKFQNYIIYKRLVLYLLGRHGQKKKEIFNVTLVARKKRKYVKQSLNKIVRNNRSKKK
ncbi:MAG: hypothetical protein IMY67_12635 [Bacteroidetes bacterium]|nr:hypothetical protein [Bacteroidota bacterium]